MLNLVYNLGRLTHTLDIGRRVVWRPPLPMQYFVCMPLPVKNPNSPMIDVLRHVDYPYDRTPLRMRLWVIQAAIQQRAYARVPAHWSLLGGSPTATTVSASEAGKYNLRYKLHYQAWVLERQDRPEFYAYLYYWCGAFSI